MERLTEGELLGLTLEQLRNFLLDGEMISPCAQTLKQQPHSLHELKKCAHMAMYLEFRPRI